MGGGLWALGGGRLERFEGRGRSWTNAGVLELITLGSCLVNNAQRNGTAHGNAQSRKNREQSALAEKSICYR